MIQCTETYRSQGHDSFLQNYFFYSFLVKYVNEISKYEQNREKYFFISNFILEN